MRLGQVMAIAGGTLVLAVPRPAMGDTLVGSFADGNVQGANSNQAATNTSGGAEFNGSGTKFISGNSAPHTSQTALNAADNTAIIGGGGGDGTLIGNGSQENSQGLNSVQGAKKGTQVSTNVASGTQIIGLGAGDSIIGSPSQASNQGLNSSQLGAGGLSGTTFIGGPVNKGPETETSTNVVISCEVVIGAPGFPC